MNFIAHLFKKNTPWGGIEVSVFILFHEFHDIGEDARIGDSEIWENLSIEFYVFEVHAVYKLRIGHTKRTNSCVQTNSPELTKVSLLTTSILVSIETSFHRCSLCVSERVWANTTKSFCELEDFFVSFLGHETTFYAYHREKIGVEIEIEARLLPPKISCILV